MVLYLLVLAGGAVGAAASLREAAILAFAAAWGNVGYMGVPLLGAAYGESAGLPAVLAVVLDIVVLQSLTILLLESGGGAAKGGLRSIGRSMVRNPLIIAVFAGAAVAGLGLDPADAGRRLSRVARSRAAAGALFALGATLRPRCPGRGRRPRRRDHRRQAAPAAGDGVAGSAA